MAHQHTVAASSYCSSPQSYLSAKTHAMQGPPAVADIAWSAACGSPGPACAVFQKAWRASQCTSCSGGPRLFITVHCYNIGHLFATTPTVENAVHRWAWTRVVQALEQAAAMCRLAACKLLQLETGRREVARVGALTRLRPLRIFPPHSLQFVVGKGHCMRRIGGIFNSLFLLNL